MFPGFTSLQILQVIQNDLQKRNTEPEKITDRIIFISMFNDIDWTRRGNDEVCISNSESQGTRAEILAWTLDVPRSWKWKDVVWKKAKSPPERKWDSVASQMVQRFKETVHPVFTSASALSRGILRVLTGKETTHFNADAPTIHSVNLLSIHGAVSNWCEQFGLTTDEKGQEKFSQKENPWTKKFSWAWIHKMWTFLVSSPRLASGNSLRRNIQDFGWLSETIQFTKYCENASFWYGVSATRTTVLEKSSHCAKIHFLECKHPQPRAYAAIPERTIIGPDIEVHIVKMLDNLGLEIAIPSPKKPRRTSYVLISKRQSRFVDELHIPKVGHDVTSAVWTCKRKRKRTFLGNNRSENLVATSVASHSSTRKLDADPFSVSSSPVRLFTEGTISTTERKWQNTPANQFIVWRISINSDLQNGYKIGASLWSRRTTIWWSSSCGHDRAETGESVRKARNTRFLRRSIGFDSSMKEAARHGSNVARIPKIVWLAF